MLDKLVGQVELGGEEGVDDVAAIVGVIVKPFRPFGLLTASEGVARSTSGPAPRSAGAVFNSSSYMASLAFAYSFAMCSCSVWGLMRESFKAEA